MANFNARSSSTDDQLINDDFVFVYHGTEWIDSDVRTNVQAVLNKMKERRYDRNLINQLLVALKGSEKRIQEFINERISAHPGSTLNLISFMSCIKRVYLTVLKAFDFSCYTIGLLKNLCNVSVPLYYMKWIVPQLSIRIKYNGTWSIVIHWLKG